MPDINWLRKPEAHDYPAAEDYLSLVASHDEVELVIDELHDSKTREYKAKDVLRSSRLPLLPKSNPYVARDLKKIHDGEVLSPVLLVRGVAKAGAPLQIADGYHRVCAVYWFDENALIPCRIAEWPARWGD